MFLHDPVDPLVPIDDLKPRGKLRHCRGDDVAVLVIELRFRRVRIVAAGVLMEMQPLFIVLQLLRLEDNVLIFIWSKWKPVSIPAKLCPTVKTESEAVSK